VLVNIVFTVHRRLPVNGLVANSDLGHPNNGRRR
jgi:hypothetical protein